MKISCIVYGKTRLPESDVFLTGDKTKSIPIALAIYLVELEDRKLLIDAGCDTMPGFEVENHVSPALAVQAVGVFPAEITDVIITHAHHDHIEAVRHFENATVHITRKAYETGKRYIPEAMPVKLVEDSLVLHPQIKMIQWGGHANGSAIVEIAHGDITHVFVGDECYVNQCIFSKIPTGASRNPEKSRKFVEKYSDPRYRVHTCHDPSLSTGAII